MTTYTTHRVEDHEPFIFEQLLPLIVGYARASNTPSEVVTMAAWLCLSTILQAKGLGRDTLLKALDAARLDVHEAPEGLH
ncbi:hypothetical protein [Pseudomonas sp. NW5]|uniref:hypothetical protein n=1 Tax=Pseudomonas sp. NW5 TaxID=2934934 RepID=UPI0020202B90|nr:hypothetical protein [Pseudomonas sp. NW5]MCL7462207.1 hypothetical protein [Pseudomonas sp. NW5]